MCRAPSGRCIARDDAKRQVAAAWDLLGTLLSARGLTQVRRALMLEAVLGQLTRNPRFRDHGNYALVIFGDPAGKGPWAWRFEGHHLSLTTVVAPEHGVAVTPVFFGANPATVPGSHAHAGFRLLGAEEDAAFGLVRSLDGDLRTQAIIAGRSLGDIVSGPGREASLQRFEGVPLSRLNDAQRTGIMRILELYAGTMREDVAAAVMAKVRDRPARSVALRLGRQPGAGQPALFPHSWARCAGRIRQYAERRQPRALGVDRPAGRVRPRSPEGALPGRALRATSYKSARLPCE